MTLPCSIFIARSNSKAVGASIVRQRPPYRGGGSKSRRGSISCSLPKRKATLGCRPSAEGAFLVGSYSDEHCSPLRAPKQQIRRGRRLSTPRKRTLPIWSDFKAEDKLFDPIRCQKEKPPRRAAYAPLA